MKKGKSKPAVIANCSSCCDPTQPHHVVPGVLLMDNSVHGLRFERCDECQRFASDEDAILSIAASLRIASRAAFASARRLGAKS